MLRERGLFLKLIGVAAVVASVVVVAEWSAPPANAETASENKIAQIAMTSVESYVPGCTNCPRTADRTPVFEINSNLQVLSEALKIVTFSAPPNVNDHETSAGGCAVTAGRSLMCWGANGAGQLGNGTTTSSLTPTAAVGISDVSDVAASGGTTCAISRSSLWCAGLGPWPNGSLTSSTWQLMTDEPVTSVVMGTHIASSVRAPICVVTAAASLKCLQTNYVDRVVTGFAWVDAGLSGVKEAVASQKYFPGQANVCALANGDVVCGTVDNFGVFTRQQLVESDVKFSRVYLFDWNYPAVCGWSSGLLACGTFSYSGAPWVPPATLRIVGVVPEPLSIAYREIDTVRRIYVVHSGGVLHFGVAVIESQTYAYGSPDSIIAPVLSFKDRVANSSRDVTRISGSTTTVELVPVVVRRTPRSLIGSRAVTITSGGRPLVGSRVTWATTDDPTLLQSSSATSYVTDSAGQVRFPQLATGAVTFTVSGGRVPDGAFLQTAVVTAIVTERDQVEVQVPVAPPRVVRSLTVRLPDGTQVPNAELRLRNAFLTYGFVSSDAGRSAWSAQQPDAMRYLSTVECAFCMVNPPTYLTDASGSVSIPVFEKAPRGAEFDASVTYDDGVISQTTLVRDISSENEAKFQFMQAIRLASPTEIRARAGGVVTLNGRLVDDLGAPISDVRVQVRPVCDEIAFGGLWNAGTSTASVPCASHFAKSVRGTGVSSQSSKCSPVGKSDKKGIARIRFCISKSMLVRVTAAGFVAGKTVCVRVGNSPCQRAFGQVSAESAASSVTVKQGKKLTASRILAARGIKVTKNSALTLSLGSAASSRCVMSKSSVVGRSRGFCMVKVTIRERGKKARSVNAVVNVS